MRADWLEFQQRWGYGPVCATLTERFGPEFDLTTTGGNCLALIAMLDGYEVLVTDGGDYAGSLTRAAARTDEGFAVGVYTYTDEDGCGDEPVAYLDDPAATLDGLPDLVGRVLEQLRSANA